MKIEDVKDTLKCCKCKKTFTSKKIKFMEPVDNITIMGSPFHYVYVDKNNIIISSTESAVRKDGDRLLCCPYCNEVHFFGFDIEKNKDGI